MVHALQALNEAWRVLKPSGVVCDIHPISTVLPIEVVKNEVRLAAGVVDVVNSKSDTMVRALMTSGALSIAEDKEQFLLEKQRFFHVNHYWDSVEGINTYFGDVITKITLDDKLLKRIGDLLDEVGTGAQVVASRTKVIGRYRKVGMLKQIAVDKGL